MTQTATRAPRSPASLAQQSQTMREHWEKKKTERMIARATHKPKNAPRELRLLCEMTQAEFAVQIGLSYKNKAQISNMETRGLRPTKRQIALMEEIAQARGLTWTYYE